MITRTLFGTLPDGREATCFELTCGAARARITDFGATLLGVEVPDHDGHLADIVLGFGALDGYLDNPACYGATVGPSANRTDRAEVPLGGAVYHLPRNEGPNNLHTDLAHGLNKRLWDAEADDAANAVRLTCRLAAGELGLPGERTFRAVYTLGEDAGAAVLTIAYTCESDAPTYVNLTNHTYVNLAGHAAGSALSQVVRVNAARFLPLRADSVSSGEIRDVAGTPFDFRASKPLGADIDAADEQLERARGYDHCFCIDGYEPGEGARHALRAEDPAAGRALDILITAPGAHLYTGNWLGDENAKDGASYRPRDGFAFEPEFYPDNVHHASWPHPVCEPGRPYRQTIVYRLSTI